MVDEFCGGFVVVVVVVGSYRVITELFLFRGVGEANGNADSRWPLPFFFQPTSGSGSLSLSLSLSLLFFCFNFISDRSWRPFNRLPLFYRVYLVSPWSRSSCSARRVPSFT